jgi:hypothetical protein
MDERGEQRILTFALLPTKAFIVDDVLLPLNSWLTGPRILEWSCTKDKSCSRARVVCLTVPLMMTTAILIDYHRTGATRGCQSIVLADSREIGLAEVWAEFKEGIRTVEPSQWGSISSINYIQMRWAQRVIFGGHVLHRRCSFVWVECCVSM